MEWKRNLEAVSVYSKIQEKLLNRGKYPKISPNQSFCVSLQNACLFIDKGSSEKYYHISPCG